VPDARIMTASDINTYVLMNSNAVILTESSLEIINKL